MGHLDFFYQPLGLAVAGLWARLFGTLRAKEYYGALNRPHYAYGLLRAAGIAR